MGRLLQGTTCPRCKRPVYLRKDRRLGEHKADTYVPFTNRRERCVYSGGTLADAAAGIAPLSRTTIDRLLAKEAASELSDAEHAWLDRHGIPECLHRRLGVEPPPHPERGLTHGT